MSSMHMAWVKSVCGRLESRYRYSKDIVYNNFPWAENPSEKQIRQIEEKAQKVLEVRSNFPKSSLADLYNPLTMPPTLIKAHNELDKAVDSAYRTAPFTSEANKRWCIYLSYTKNIQPIYLQKKSQRRKNNIT